MKLLALDTSTEQASISLYDGRVFKNLEEKVQKQHSLWILPAIHKILEEARLSIKDLDGIVFGRGPGSFTGLRIAAAVAKGLSLAAELPLYPVSTLQAIAEPYLTKIKNLETGILAMIDARMQQVYWSYYHDKDFRSEALSNPEDIKLAPPLNLFLVGVGFEAYRANLPKEIQNRILQSYESYPLASSMINLVLAGKIKQVIAKDAEPIYIRNQVVQGAKSHE